MFSGLLVKKFSNLCLFLTGPRLYKQPTTKSNRGIMLNAVEYCVFPGTVNKEAKRRVLDEIARSESKHFLILFRDAGCQFRALYSYCPDREEVSKLYGTGPKQVIDKMFDKFFKWVLHFLLLIVIMGLFLWFDYPLQNVFIIRQSLNTSGMYKIKNCFILAYNSGY